MIDNTSCCCWYSRLLNWNYSQYRMTCHKRKHGFNDMCHCLDPLSSWQFLLLKICRFLSFSRIWMVEGDDYRVKTHSFHRVKTKMKICQKGLRTKKDTQVVRYSCKIAISLLLETLLVTTLTSAHVYKDLCLMPHHSLSCWKSGPTCFWTTTLFFHAIICILFYCLLFTACVYWYINMSIRQCNFRLPTWS